MRYHAIIIGGGHNGLTAAAYLARAGRKVLVLERRHVLGGAAVTEELYPGFRYSVCSYVVSLLRPQIIRELDLARHGLKILPLDGTFTPMPGGNYLWRVDDHQTTHREIARHSRRDADAYEGYVKTMVDMARFVKPILDMTPPDPASSNPRDLLKLASLVKRFRGLSTSDRQILVQLMSLSAADFLGQWFETDVLKATMAASGIIGTFQGARSPGTAYVLLHHYMGELDGVFRTWGVPVGGTGAVSHAIAEAGRQAGVEIRTEAPVARIRTKNQRAVGVVLANGDELDADLVLSSVDPRLTFLTFLDPAELPPDFVEQVKRYRFRGASAKVNLALDALPQFTALPTGTAHLQGRDLHLAFHGLHRTGVRRGEVRRLFAPPVYRHGHPDADGSVDGASGKAHRLLFRPIRTLCAAPAGTGMKRASRSAIRSSTRWPSMRRTSGT